MRVRISCIAAAALAAALLTPAGPASAEDDMCGRPKGTPEALYERITKVEKLREMRRSEVYVALEDGNDGTLWTFTLPGHSAHPAAVCRRVVERRGIIDIPTTIVCNGPEGACAKLKSDFDELNNMMIQELYKQKK